MLPRCPIEVAWTSYTVNVILHTICSIILFVWNFVNRYWCRHPTRTCNSMLFLLLGKRVFDVFIEGCKWCPTRVRFYFLYVLRLHAYFKWRRSDLVLVFIPTCCISSHFTSLLEDLLADHSGMTWLVWMRLLSLIWFFSLWKRVHIAVVILFLNRCLGCYVRHMCTVVSACHVVVEHFQIDLHKFWWFNWICDHLVRFLVIIILWQLILL